MKNRLLGKLAFAAMSCLLVFSLASCGKAAPANEEAKQSETKTIYTTFFPVYDLTKLIAGDKADIKMIIKGSEEPHSFELNPAQMADIVKADLIIYNGAGMESFVPDLKNACNDDDKFLDLSQGLTLLESDHSDHDHEHEKSDAHDKSNGQDDADHSSVNPHTWLSIKNAEVELDTIYKKLCSIDPANKDYYKENLEKALPKFKELDKKFADQISRVDQDKRYFVVSHAAFNYLAHDYGLEQVAVTGISPEDEPSAKQLKTIADFVKKHDITTIFFEGKATPKVARTLAENTQTKTDTIYTMENLTDEEASWGYVKLMEKNLEALMKSFETK